MTPAATPEALLHKRWTDALLQAQDWREQARKAEATLATATAEAASLRAEVEALKADRDDAIRMLDVWFDTSTKTNEQVVPQLVDALVGYLRTCRCGGMPAETSDMIEAGAADFIRRRAGYIIAPVIETMVADRTADLRVEVEGLKAALKPHQAPPLSTALARAATAGRVAAMGERIRALIKQAEFWRQMHARAGHSIDAAACDIRIRALQDALKIVEAGRHG